MILIRRLNGEEFILNAELIESVESCPDTLVTLTNGKKLMVLNDHEEIVNKIIDYRQRVYAAAPVRAGKESNPQFQAQING
jgi:flagellar protein FlbD